MTENAWLNTQADDDIGNGDNWLLGHAPLYPDTAGEDLRFNNAEDMDFLNHPDGGLICHDIDCTGYTGEWYFSTGSPDMNISVSGSNVTFSAGMTISDGVVGIGSLPGCTGIHIDANGQTNFGVQISDGQTLTFAGDTSLKYLSAGVTSPEATVVEWSSHVITILMTGTQEYGVNVAGSGTTINYSAGAKLIFSGPAGSYGDINCSPGGAVLPPIECDTGIQIYNGGDNINCESLLMGASSGGAWLGSGVHVVTVGDCTWLGGPLTSDGTTEKIPGVVFDCGGNFSAAINLNSAAGDGEIAIFNVVGLAEATGGASQTIKNCDFSGGSELQATGCVDGGGNVHVNFSVKTTNSAAIGAGAGF